MLQPGQVFRDCPDVCPEMVVIRPGQFLMGSPSSEARRYKVEGPQHNVIIPNLVAIGRFEVTFVEWESCVAGGGCQSNRSPSDAGWGKVRRPVINVSWDDAQEYLVWLSRKTSKNYRLLTEAEWEYAARARTTTPFATGRTITTGQANFDGNHTYAGSPRGLYRQQTVDVGSFLPNAFGLHDMHGNVWEWVQDCYHGHYARKPDQLSKSGASWTDDCQDMHVIRGGAWDHPPEDLRSASRGPAPGGERKSNIGFRVARTF